MRISSGFPPAPNWTSSSAISELSSEALRAFESSTTFGRGDQRSGDERAQVLPSHGTSANTGADFRPWGVKTIVIRIGEGAGAERTWLAGAEQPPLPEPPSSSR